MTRAAARQPYGAFKERLMEDDWVEIRNCAWLHEAEFIASLLAADDIQTLVPDANTVGVYPGLVPALGGIRVLVRRSDVRKATERLATFDTDPPPAA
jgi:hypothetical protein